MENKEPEGYSRLSITKAYMDPALKSKVNSRHLQSKLVTYITAIGVCGIVMMVAYALFSAGIPR